MIKQCLRCKDFRFKAIRVNEGHNLEKERTWECKKGHKIKNPYAMNDCKDFEEKP